MFANLFSGEFLSDVITLHFLIKKNCKIIFAITKRIAATERKHEKEQNNILYTASIGLLIDQQKLNICVYCVHIVVSKSCNVYSVHNAAQISVICNFVTMKLRMVTITHFVPICTCFSLK